MFAVRQGAGRSGVGSLPHWRAARRPRLRPPASGLELGYIALTATFAAILGVAVVSFTNTNTDNVAPASAGARTGIATVNAETTGIGRITGDDRMRPALIHNLSTRSAITSAVGRF